MIEVKVENNNLEKAIRILKKKVNESGILQQLKNKRYYKKPSEIRREKKKQFLRETQKNQKRSEKK